MRESILLLVILGVDALLLFLEVSGLSISTIELNFLNNSTSPLRYIIEFSFSLFGKNDFALRVPMIIMHLFTVLLMYKISYQYLERRSERVIFILMFILLPGIQSSALLVNPAGMIFLFLLIYISVYKINIYINYTLLVLLMFIDVAFSNLYLGLFFYAMYKKDTKTLLYSLLLFTISMYYYKVDVGGIPSGYFLDIFGIYAALLTPIIFLYLIYTLYKKVVIRDMELIVVVSMTSFVFSLILSLRQNIAIESFASFLMLSLIVAMQTFVRSYRVRLKEFRKRYQVLFIVAFVILILNEAILLFNSYLYVVIDDPKNLFTNKVHVAKELAVKLDENNITCINLNDRGMQNRLKFYGVNVCKLEKIWFKESEKEDEVCQKVTVSYHNRDVYQINVSKIHKIENE